MGVRLGLLSCGVGVLGDLTAFWGFRLVLVSEFLGFWVVGFAFVSGLDFGTSGCCLGALYISWVIAVGFI